MGFDPDQHFEVVIVGAGPAGLTAALYAARANLSPLVLEGEMRPAPNTPGGQLNLTSEVENFPGFPKGVGGPELVENIRAQALRFGARIEMLDVKSVDLASRPFTVEVSGGWQIRATTLIISTGASARLLGLPGEVELMRNNGGVSACAVCDGFFFKGKEVAVVGGGDTALEEAIYLTKFCPKVTLIHRRDELRASNIMQERARKNPRIEFKWNSVVEGIEGINEGRLSGLLLRSVTSGESSVFKCEGLFVAIGHDPNTGFLNDQLATDDHGFIKVQSPSTATSVPGVFACGDVMDPNYKQAITAAGTGCSAAIDAERFIEANKG